MGATRHAGVRVTGQRALTELRDLALGIHPAVLSERGRAAALEGLIARSPVPVELRASHERVAPAAEAAIHFTVAEARTNDAKHAQAGLARVQVDIQAGTLIAEVADDGVGGAAATRAQACADSPTGWTRSAARSRSTVLRAAGRSSAPASLRD
jgi:signal transduction histidine kinase